MIAIAGGKGGCGKTTTTVALARALADRLDRPTYAVDADWDMPDLHSLAGVESTPSLAELEGAPRRVAHSIGDPPVRILPAPTAAEPRAGDDAAAALRSLSRARAGVDPPPALLDCPAGAGRDAAAPLRAADATVLVSTTAPASLRDAAKTAAMAASLDAPVAAAALTRADAVPDGASRLLDTDCVVPVPAAGTPLADARVARAYAELAHPVARRVLEPADGRRRPDRDVASSASSASRSPPSPRRTKRQRGP